MFTLGNGAIEYPKNYIYLFVYPCICSWFVVNKIGAIQPIKNIRKTLFLFRIKKNRMND